MGGGRTERMFEKGPFFLFALVSSALLWLVESLIFFIHKIVNPRIWFFPSLKSLLLYLGAGILFFVLALLLGLLIGPEGREDVRRQDRLFLFLSLLLGAYTASLFFVRIRPRIAPGRHDLVSFLALAGIVAAFFGLSYFLSRAAGSVFTAGRPLRVMGVIAALPVAFCLINAVIDINVWTIPRAAPKMAAPGPNLVIVLFDSLRRDSLGCYGNSAVRTPNIDLLSREAIVFDDCVSQAPWTLPSLGSLLTSKYPSQHGAERQRILNPKTLREEKVLKSGWLREENVTLFEILRANGYVTAFLQPNVTSGSRRGLDQGVDFFFDLFKPGRTILEDAVGWLSRERINEALDPRFSYATNERVVRYAKRWLRRNAEQKYCLFILLFDCHEYYLDVAGYRDSPNLDRGTYAELLRRTYRAHAEKADRDFGDLLAELEKTPRFSRTAVVLLADHGEEIFDHSGTGEAWGPSYGARLFHGQTLYDEVLRVPLIMKLPAGRNFPARVPAQVRTIDILPTLVSVLGLKSAASFEGVDLSRRDFRTEDPLPAFSESLLEFPEMKSLRKDGWKLIFHPLRGPGREFDLYDLSRDPGETDNLADSESATREKLKSELFAWIERMDRERAKIPGSSEKRELTGQEKQALRSLGYIR